MPIRRLAYAFPRKASVAMIGSAMASWLVTLIPNYDGTGYPSRTYTDEPIAMFRLPRSTAWFDIFV